MPLLSVCGLVQRVQRVFFLLYALFQDGVNVGQIVFKGAFEIGLLVESAIFRQESDDRFADEIGRAHV